MLKNKKIYINAPTKVMFIGDVHGHYSKVMQLITQLEPDWFPEEINLASVEDVIERFRILMNLEEHADFEPTTNFVFVGDLIDRGPQSFEMLQLMAGVSNKNECGYSHHNQLLNSVWGNHEEIMYRALGGEPEYMDCWLRNGGSWFTDLSKKDRRTAELAIEKLHETCGDVINLQFFPEGGEVASKFVGVVHAECPTENWVKFLSRRGCRQDALWGRDNINNRRGFTTIKNIDLVISGHTPRKEVVSIDNQRWINVKHTVGGLLVGLDNETQALTETFIGVF